MNVHWKNSTNESGGKQEQKNLMRLAISVFKEASRNLPFIFLFNKKD
jgi:hypothetical protein